MREIIFRGKRKDNGEWVEGSLVTQGDQRFIDCTTVKYERYSQFFAFHEFTEVIPETVGQYTGQTDKNGKRIFEGDIIKYPYHANNDIIAFENGAFGYKNTRFDYFCAFDDCEYGIATDLAEISGNIHDNPELLKGGEV